MSNLKKIAQFIILFSLVSCRLFRSDEQNAIRDIDKFQKKLDKIYIQYPQFRRVDTVETIVTIDNPIVKFDTVVEYKDTIIIEDVYNTIVRTCKNPQLARKVADKVSKYKCIKDSIVVKDTLYKVIVKQDSLGIHVNIYPNDSTLSLKYKVPCPKTVLPEDAYYSHKEFWFVVVFLLFAIFVAVFRVKV